MCVFKGKTKVFRRRERGRVRGGGAGFEFARGGGLDIGGSAEGKTKGFVEPKGSKAEGEAEQEAEGEGECGC
jgi:hypothetical protein